MDVDKWLGSITPYEAVQIWTRLKETCDPNGIVLWSGIDFDEAQEWAKRHGRKTLTLALGPLMDRHHPGCRYHLKDTDQWCRYVHAASILLTLYASNGTEVVVLTPHPPQRLNPYNESYYQNIEEPWLMACCDASAFQIRFAHPDIHEAEGDVYQYWPVDSVDDWKARHPHAKGEYHWPHHTWDVAQLSRYHPDDLRRERCNIMQKMYLYRTGASVYWKVAIPANTTGITEQDRQQAKRDEARIRRHRRRELRRRQMPEQQQHGVSEEQAARGRQVEKRKTKKKNKRNKAAENEPRAQANRMRKEEKKRIAAEKKRKKDERRRKQMAEEERSRRRKEEKKRAAEEEQRRAKEKKQAKQAKIAEQAKAAVSKKKAKQTKKQAKKTTASGSNPSGQATATKGKTKVTKSKPENKPKAKTPQPNVQQTKKTKPPQVRKSRNKEKEEEKRAVR